MKIRTTTPYSVIAVFLSLRLLCSLFLPVTVIAQEHAIYTYERDQYPYLGTVTTIFQDSRGFMWFGGDRGVACYDGREFKRFSTLNGLVGNHVYTIKESPSGEIWICTYNGINVYNPLSGTLKFLADYSRQAIRDLEFITDDVLIGTSGRALMMSGIGHFDFVQYKEICDSTITTPVNDLFYDKDTGVLWIASAMAGVIKVNYSQFSRLWEMKDKSLFEEYKRIGKDLFHKRHPELTDKGVNLCNMELSLDLFVIDDPDARRRLIYESSVHLNRNNKYEDWFVNSIHKDDIGTIYAHSRDKIYRLTDNYFRHVRQFNDLAGAINFFEITPEGEFLFAGENGGFLIAGQDTLNFSQETGLSENRVTSMFKDYQSICWMATGDVSLHKIIDPSILIFDADEYEMLDKLSSAIKLKNNKILLGGQAGISLLHKGKLVPFQFQIPSSEQFIDFTLDKNSDIIIVSDRTIYLYRDGKARVLATDIESIYSEVKFVLEEEEKLWIMLGMKVFTWDGDVLKSHDALAKHVFLNTYAYLGADSSIFFGTWRGIHNLKNDIIKRYTYGSISQLKLPGSEFDFEFTHEWNGSRVLDDVITCGGLGSDGAYWFGTYGGGILRLDGDSIKSYSIKENVVSMHFNNSVTDSVGNIYFLGDEGVNIVADGKINQLRFDFQSKPEFYDMAIDRKNRQLFATSNGLIIRTPQRQMIIDDSYGFKSGEFRKLINLYDDKWLLLQSRGFICVDIEQLIASESAKRPLTITGIVSGDEDIRIEQHFQLSPQQRDITIKFNLNNFIAESKNRYAWYLEGLEEEYNHFSSEQHAHYQRLPAGQYTFHLKAVNSNGVTSFLTIPPSFEIKPFFYETKLFTILLIAVGCVLIYLIIVLRIRQVRRINRTLETKVKERTKELEQAASNIKALTGLIPICAGCKNIRDDEGYWQQVEEYISVHSEATFSHGICPSCMEKLYPDVYDKMNGNNDDA